MDDVKKKRLRKRILIAVAVVVVFLLFYIDDWGRDFTTSEASITAQSFDPYLAQLIEARPPAQIAAGIKMAGRRIGNWSYVGEAEHDGKVSIMFVRQNRLLRLRNDIVVQIGDVDGRSTVRADSRSRLDVGDLGRNPRTLRRFYSELRSVLQESSPNPVLRSPMLTGGS